MFWILRTCNADAINYQPCNSIFLQYFVFRIPSTGRFAIHYVVFDVVKKQTIYLSISVSSVQLHPCQKRYQLTSASHWSHCLSGTIQTVPTGNAQLGHNGKILISFAGFLAISFVTRRASTCSLLVDLGNTDVLTSTIPQHAGIRVYDWKTTKNWCDNDIMQLETCIELHQHLKPINRLLIKVFLNLWHCTALYGNNWYLTHQFRKGNYVQTS